MIDSPQSQKIAIIRGEQSFKLAGDQYIRFERFIIVDDYPEYAGQRLTIMAHVDTIGIQGNMIKMDVAIASFVIGQNYDQEANHIISAADKTVLSVVGPSIPIQVQFTLYNSD